MSTAAVATLLFGSGFSALVYQTAWQRSLRLVFGASTAASAAVLAVFLGGLGVGGLVLSRRAERSERPLLLYGNLEGLVTALAVLSPLSIDLLGRAYIATGGVSSLGQAGATVVRLAITALAIGPAAILMGGTLPAAARAVEHEGDRSRTRLSVLYGVNTLGAVTGALAGTFLLFELLGSRLTLCAAALINALVALVARSLGRVAPPITLTETSTMDERQHEVRAAADDRSGRALVYGVAALAGFSFLLMEIVWYRMLAPILGGSTYTFGLVLALALLGIGLGGALYSLRGKSRPPTFGELALVTSLEAACVAVPLALGDAIAIYASLTRPLGAMGFSALVGAWCSVTAFVILPAAVLSGYQLPLLFALLGSGRTQVARQVGVLYAWNTGGSILGALLGGFALVPMLGGVGAWRLVVWVLGGAAAITLARATIGAAARGSLLRGAGTAGVLVAAAWLATRAGPTAVWRHQPIGAGRAAIPTKSTLALEEWMDRENARIIWQADGVETAVALQRGNQLAFLVDGKADGSSLSDRGTQVGLAMVPALLHPAPRRAAVIGLGTGMTAGWLAAVPGMERVHVLELEPSILDVARAMKDANLDVLSQPNVTIHVGDGREYLRTTGERFDLVVSQPSNPYRAGISAFYTRELYEAALETLNPGGIFVQWVQGYEIDGRALAIMAKTLASVFEHLEVWQTQLGDLMMLGSRGPRTLDAAERRQRLLVEPYRTAFARTLHVGDLEGVLGRFVATQAIVHEVAGFAAAVVNTDDSDVLGYAFASTVGSGDGTVAEELMELGLARDDNRPTVRGDVDWERVAELRSRTDFIAGDALGFLPMPSPAARSRALAAGLGCKGHAVKALAEWRAQPQDPRDPIELYVVAAGLAERGDESTLELAEQLANGGFQGEAAVLAGTLLLGRTEVAPAMDQLARAVHAFRREPFPLCDAGKRALGLGQALARWDAALVPPIEKLLSEAPFAALTLDDDRLAAVQGVRP